MPENEPDPESDLENPAPSSEGSIYGNMPPSPPLSGRQMSGNVPPSVGDWQDSFAEPSPCQVTPAVLDAAAAFERRVANRDDGGALVLADPGLRLAGYMIDMALFFVPFTIIVLVIDGPSAFDEGTDPSLPAALLAGGHLMAMFVTYLVLVCTRGQSLGKMAVGTRIVIDRTGETAGFVNIVLLRNFVAGLPMLIPCVNFVYFIVDCCFIFQAGHRTLHDLIGGTSVIKVPKVETEGVTQM